jgi:hypothetical protein
MARPSTYNAQAVETICEMVATGVPVHRIPEHEGMPAESTIYLWLQAHPEFSEKYAHAKSRLADRFAAEVVTIADEADPTTMKGIEHARTRMDARKWASGKLAPKKYGEWKRTEVTGADGGAIETATRVDLSTLPDDVLQAIAKANGIDG